MELYEINILLLLFSILYFCNHLSNSYIFISTGIYILIYIFLFQNKFFSQDHHKNNFVNISLYIFFNLCSFIISLVSLSSIGDKQNRIITNIQIKRIGHILTLVYLTMIMMYIIYKFYTGGWEVLGKVIILIIILLSISFITFIYPKLNVFTNNYKCHKLNQSNIKQTFDCDVEPILT